MVILSVLHWHIIHQIVSILELTVSRLLGTFFDHLILQIVINYGTVSGGTTGLR